MHRVCSAIAAFALGAGCSALAGEGAGVTVRVPAGSYIPFYSRESSKTVRDPAKLHQPVQVDAFLLDRYPVTNAEFLAFVRDHPQWRKSQIKPLFADAHYLTHWTADLSLREASDAARPVTNVSWFAAEAYCEAQDKALPTTDQWEYALVDRGIGSSALRIRILAWYGSPAGRAIPVVQASAANGYGVNGLIGLVWEWTLDFNSLMSGPDLRSSGSGDSARFCGGASLGASDAGDYASFMRYSMRESLRASYATSSLGFRCAKNGP